VVAITDNLKILLVIEKLDKIYQKIGVNGLFLVRAERLSSAAMLFLSTIVAKDLLSLFT